MEPRIQYAKTKDGVSIAFYSIGEGLPLVYMTGWPYQHLQLEWKYPVFTNMYELILEKRRLIRFDGRGSGLSDRSMSDYSLQARLLDLESVVERLGLEKFDLLASMACGPVAITYAARNPDRLSHLVLSETYARGEDYGALPQIRALRRLIDTDWEIFTETAAHVMFGWSEGEGARRYAAFMRECVLQEDAISGIEERMKVDVTDLLPQVNTPTLVIQRRQVPVPTVDIARGLASRIPSARLVVLEGDFGMPEEVRVDTILEFLGEGEEAGAAAEPPETSAFRTVLFTDVEGSTALTQRLGDARARDVLRQHERMVREALKAHGGSEVKTMGDGFMVSFSSATRALECAIAIQRAFAEHNETATAHPEPVEGRAEVIRVRIGLNAGEPIAEDEDLFGTAVIRAARIAAKAAGGEILASDVVRQLVEGKDFLFADRGETTLRGFDEPVRLYEVRWQPDQTARQ
ncbi:MAG: adenylate/guanylate cyclase domain-containing protein [Dehalococcoidia bacterium]